MSTTEITIEAPPKESDLLTKTIAVSLYIGDFGTRARVSKDKIDSEADKEFLHIFKDIIDPKAVKELKKTSREFRQWVRRLSLPCPMFKRGVYLLPTEVITRVQARKNKFIEERVPLVEALIDRLPKLKEQAQKSLGNLYDENDYPSDAVIRAAFQLELRYISFQTPDKLRTIDEALWNEQREKMAEEWDQAQEAVVTLLRTEMQKLVAHMVDRLTPDVDGKPKVFRNSLLPNLSEFLENFSFRNVTGDEDLERLVKRAKALLAGVDSVALRNDDLLRTKTVEAFESVKGQLDTLVAERPSRLISFDDE